MQGERHAQMLNPNLRRVDSAFGAVCMEHGIPAEGRLLIPRVQGLGCFFRG